MVYFWWDLHKSQSPAEKSGQEKKQVRWKLLNRIPKSKGIKDRTTKDFRAISLFSRGDHSNLFEIKENKSHF